MDKIITAEQAAAMVEGGDRTVMIAGFGTTGTPNHILKSLADLGTIDLSIIAGDFGQNNRGFRQGIALLVGNGQVSRAQISFTGVNPEAAAKAAAGEIDVTFIPLGTLVERIRCGGYGIGGFYTRTGVGTLVAEGKESKVIDGVEYLLEKPLRADVGLVKAYKADKFGNAVFRYTARGYNEFIAMACDNTILEVEELVEVGDIQPDEVQLPGIFVNHIVVGKEAVL